MSTAAIIIIGDELLHAEITDENGPWLISQLNELGVDVSKLYLLPDRHSVLVNHLKKSLSEDYVLTTGGIGPTHDDRTRQAVAEALDVELEPNEKLMSLLKNRHGEHLNESQKQMANLPRGSDLIHVQNTSGMAFQVKNVFVFPGIPELLKPLFERWSNRFTGNTKHKRDLTIRGLESDIAQELEHLQDQYPELDFGSYPHEDGTLTLKVRGRNSNNVTEAYEEMTEIFNPWR